MDNNLLDGWMDGWMDGLMDGWMDGWIDGWMDIQKIRKTYMYIPTDR